jgi:peptidylprolyl isomerase
VTTTAKRQRQREGRVARMEAERKAAVRAARRRRIIIAVVVTALVIGLAGLASVFGGDDDEGNDEAATTTTTGASPSTTAPEKPDVTVPDTPPPATLQSTDLVVGDGAEARAGSEVQVHYVGKAYSTKQEFDASYGNGEAFSFTLGQGGVIPGWDQGVAGMRVGGRRQLVIPPDLAYGEQGQPPDIGPNETLVFVIDLLAVDETPAQPGG